jgi:hypothetical protein
MPKLKSEEKLAEFEEKIDKNIQRERKVGKDDVVYWPRKG